MKRKTSRSIAQFKLKARRLMIEGRIDDMIQLLSSSLRGPAGPMGSTGVRHAL